MRRKRQHVTRWVVAGLMLWLGTASTAFGYFFDERREMSLSGFAYTRATFATSDGIASQERTYYAGNMVQHRNFLTLEWRHNISRLMRGFPTIGPAMEFLNFDSFDYFLNMRTEYDGVYDYGPMKIRSIMRGTRLHQPYFDDRRTSTPFDGLYFTPNAAFPNPADTISLSNRRHMRELRGANVRLFEWYFNITKGPLFIRVGKQNLSWGESDAFRLLDQINPLDNTFAGFLTSLDERRIPLNMLRAQWSFGTVGPITDLTLEGFYSVDNEVPPVLPTSSVYFWGTPQGGGTPIMYGRTPCGGDFMVRRGIPAYDYASTNPILQERFGGRYAGSGPGPRNGGDCSVRGDGPHSNLTDGRGGGRITGTISDFTFSIAHYYTYQDLVAIRGTLIAPTPDHVRWDVGLPTNSLGQAWTANPWGPNDPMEPLLRSLCESGDPRCSSPAHAQGRGGAAGRFAGLGSRFAAERLARFTLNYQRIQVTGASLSFPVNALTGMFVGSDNPLYYLYTTVRSEVAFFQNVPTNQAYAHLDEGVPVNRFLGLGDFAPGGPLAHEAGRRTVALAKRDHLAWVIGLDHNQWIRWLNPANSVFFSVQQFWLHRNGQDTKFDRSRPFGPLNDRDKIAGAKRQFQKLVTNPALAAVCNPNGSGARTGCSAWEMGGEDMLTTLVVNTPYMGGNLRPSFTFFYDWSGSYLLQPGVDWRFWDPFAVSIRYNFLEGRGNAGLGIQNHKDNVWIEFQYLLY